MIRNAAPHRSAVRSGFAARVLAALMSLGGPALAFDATISAPGLSQDTIDTLQAASLTYQLSSTQGSAAAAQDIVAAARADYERMIGVLYDNGHFGPVVSIRVDGREAATIPVLSGPLAVQRVELSITPGPAFRFGTAHMSPLPTGAQVPEGEILVALVDE